MSAGGQAQDLIEQAVGRVQSEVPALAPLKLVVALELRGRGDVQHYRVELPGPKVTKGVAADARVELSLPRSHFNELARDGGVKQWRHAFETGAAQASGPTEILQLIDRVVAKHEERGRVKKARRRP